MSNRSESSLRADAVPPTRLLTEREAAEHLRLSPRTLRRFRADGTLGFIALGRRIFYRLADLEGLVEHCHVPGSASPAWGGRP